MEFLIFTINLSCYTGFYSIKDWHAFTEKNTPKKMPTDGAENSGDNCVSVNDYKLVFFYSR